jgi:hypothetical protein
MIEGIKDSHLFTISAHAGQIFTALDFDQLKAVAGREAAIVICKTFLEIYRDTAPTEEEWLTRQKGVSAFMKKHKV